MPSLQSLLDDVFQDWRAEDDGAAVTSWGPPGNYSLRDEEEVLGGSLSPAPFSASQTPRSSGRTPAQALPEDEWQHLQFDGAAQAFLIAESLVEATEVQIQGAGASLQTVYAAVVLGGDDGQQRRVVPVLPASHLTHVDAHRVHWRVRAPIADPGSIIPLFKPKATTISDLSAMKVIKRACSVRMAEEGSCETCPICLEMMVRSQLVWRLPCAHEIHHACARRLFTAASTKPACPLCRGLILA